jgi:hypothetical protein
LGESLHAASERAATHAIASDGSVLDIRYIKVSSILLWYCGWVSYRRAKIL